MLCLLWRWLLNNAHTRWNGTYSPNVATKKNYAQRYIPIKESRSKICEIAALVQWVIKALLTIGLFSQCIYCNWLLDSCALLLQSICVTAAASAGKLLLQIFYCQTSAKFALQEYVVKVNIFLLSSNHILTILSPPFHHFPTISLLYSVKQIERTTWQNVIISFHVSRLTPRRIQPWFCLRDHLSGCN